MTVVHFIVSVNVFPDATWDHSIMQQVKLSPQYPRDDDVTRVEFYMRRLRWFIGVLNVNITYIRVIFAELKHKHPRNPQLMANSDILEGERRYSLRSAAKDGEVHNMAGQAMPGVNTAALQNDASTTSVSDLLALPPMKKYHYLQNMVSKIK